MQAFIQPIADEQASFRVVCHRIPVSTLQKKFAAFLDLKGSRDVSQIFAKLMANVFTYWI
jgi:hypothetical protein